MPLAHRVLVRARMRAAFAFAVALTLAATPARTDDAWNDERRDAHREGDGDFSVWRRQLAIAGHVGFGTPYGLAGVAVEATPIPWWTIGGGVGTSFSGPQLAVSSRVRYLFGHSALAAGMAASRGPYDTNDGWGGTWRKHWDHAAWLAFEGSIEHRWSTGMEVRFYLGASGLLNPSSGECTPNDRRETRTCASGGPIFGVGNETVVPYIGFAFGRTFAL